MNLRSEPKRVPICYTKGFQKASEIDPDTASNYVAHTSIGDPEADAVVEELGILDPALAMQYISAGMDQNEKKLIGAPSVLKNFLADICTVPDWVNFESFIPGIKMFHRNSKIVLAAFVCGVLIEGFSTNISKSFFITGRLRESGVRRLKQNNRHMVEIFMPSGLLRNGDGWKLSVRIRLVHAQVRYLLKHSDDWDTEAWGEPLSSAHVGYAITAFSARLLDHMKVLGAKFTEEEERSFLAIWRYSGLLMGIPETILFRTKEDALKLFRIGYICEPDVDENSIVMANSLINSAPLVAGFTDSKARRDLAKYVYSVSRALIGHELADALEYPKQSTIGVLPWFRLQGHYNRLMGKLFSGHVRHNNYTNFTGLMDVSEFDEQGISYRLPDHIHSERSSKW
ncbi:MAG: oxygenase MpaB family protein [Bryobacterales bacterium]|nr:oxygenase MpaB family protein [Bryobacterales bacterium]MDE0625428.1 oxygenase MpaB family protein [Bryobacterales bacterium]